LTVYIALLRSVNVGGNGRLVMADLREMAEGLGHTNVRTLVATGNLIFESKRKTPARLEKELEDAALKRLDLTVDIIVRTAKEWAAVVEANPFPEMAKDDPSHLVVMAMKKKPTAAGVEAVRAAVKGPEVVEAAGRELYITYPSGIGTSPLSGAVIERRLGMRGTARNWNTVTRIAEAVTG
jgi:uncharacterized protein (DUF1697 family)